MVENYPVSAAVLMGPYSVLSTANDITGSRKIGYKTSKFRKERYKTGETLEI